MSSCNLLLCCFLYPIRLVMKRSPGGFPVSQVLTNSVKVTEKQVRRNTRGQIQRHISRLVFLKVLFFFGGVPNLEHAHIRQSLSMIETKQPVKCSSFPSVAWLVPTLIGTCAVTDKSYSWGPFEINRQNLSSFLLKDKSVNFNSDIFQGKYVTYLTYCPLGTVVSNWVAQIIENSTNDKLLHLIQVSQHQCIRYKAL